MAIESTDLTVNGINIRCFHKGTGADTILLLHGGGVDSAMLSWREVIGLLPEKYRVIAPDLPGYGASDHIDGEYSLAFYTEIVQGIILDLGFSPVILAGLSLGGGISLNLALQYPELLKLVIPVDAWGLFEKLPYHRFLYWFTRSRLNKNLYKWTKGSSAFIRWSLEYNLFGDKSVISQSLLEEVQKAMSETGAGQDDEAPVGGVIGTGGKCQQAVTVLGVYAGFVQRGLFSHGDIIIKLRFPQEIFRSTLFHPLSHMVLANSLKTSTVSLS